MDGSAKHIASVFLLYANGGCFSCLALNKCLTNIYILKPLTVFTSTSLEEHQMCFYLHWDLSQNHVFPQTLKGMKQITQKD